MILLNTKKYKANILFKGNNYRLWMRSSCEFEHITNTLSNEDIKDLEFSYNISDILGKYYETNIKIKSSDCLVNQFKSNIAKFRNLNSSDFKNSYKNFENKFIPYLDFYNRIYKESKLYNELIKYGGKFLDLLGKKKVEFSYNECCYEYDNKLYFDIDIVGIDVSLFKNLGKSNQLQPLLNEIIFNYGLPYSVSYGVNIEDYKYNENPMDVFIITCILCYIITESINACNKKESEKLKKIFRNVNLETVNIKRDNTYSIVDFQNKLNQMYSLLKDKIIKKHILQTNSYCEKKIIKMKKDTKAVYETNDLVMFMFNYLTNNIINGMAEEFNTLKEIEILEDFRELQINKVLLSNLNDKQKEDKINKIKNKSYKKLQKKFNRMEKSY